MAAIRTEDETNNRANPSHHAPQRYALTPRRLLTLECSEFPTFSSSGRSLSPSHERAELSQRTYRKGRGLKFHLFTMSVLSDCGTALFVGEKSARPFMRGAIQVSNGASPGTSTFYARDLAVSMRVEPALSPTGTRPEGKAEAKAGGTPPPQKFRARALPLLGS